MLVLQQGRAYAVMHDTLPLLLNPNTNNTMTLNFDPAEVGTIRRDHQDSLQRPVPTRGRYPRQRHRQGRAERPMHPGQPDLAELRWCSAWAVGCQDVRHSELWQPHTQRLDHRTWSILWHSDVGRLPDHEPVDIWRDSSGGSQIVEITYAPRRAGLDSGFFLVRNDDPSNSAARVNVSGTSEAPPIADQDIHVEVEWDSNDTDVDTHMLLLPCQGLFCDNDCYFSNPEPDWGVQGDWLDDPFLDRDDVDGYGPENINIAKGINNQTYRVVLHYWRDSYNNSFSSASNVTVKLYIRGALIQTWGPIYLGSTGDTKNVFEIDWPSQTIRGFNDPLYSVPSSTSCRATP
ncbi:MAG: hypothetical protein R3E66_21200 [bacterium]